MWSKQYHSSNLQLANEARIYPIEHEDKWTLHTNVRNVLVLEPIGKTKDD